jgi:ribosomal protein L11 methyltransferase
VRVPLERAEEARAELLEFAAHGFEERDLPGLLELAVYGGPEVEEALRRSFAEVFSERVEPGWEDNWRAFHRPVEIGRLWVGPPWEEAPETLLPVVIDPGRAFGTGAHPTTRLCLELFQELEPPASLLDVGCGSGVLAIAAAKLGFAPVSALDNDSEAIEATLANAEVNGVSLDVRLVDAAAGSLPPAEVVVCNISLQALEELAAKFESQTLVASGFLAGEQPRLSGFEVQERREQSEWGALVAHRRRRGKPGA